MNNATYGRKIVKNIVKDDSVYKRKLVLSWAICYITGLISGAILMLLIHM